MPNFTVVQQKLDSYNKASALLAQVRATYQQAKQVQAALALYTAGTDTDFNQTINAIFSAGERQQLNQMLTQVSALVTNWEANHANLLTDE
jgi:hypothetical protein